MVESTQHISISLHNKQTQQLSSVHVFLGATLFLRVAAHERTRTSFVRRAADQWQCPIASCGRHDWLSAVFAAPPQPSPLLLLLHQLASLLPLFSARSLFAQFCACTLAAHNLGCAGAPLLCARPVFGFSQPEAGRGRKRTRDQHKFKCSVKEKPWRRRTARLAGPTPPGRRSETSKPMREAEWGARWAERRASWGRRRGKCPVVTVRQWSAHRNEAEQQ